MIEQRNTYLYFQTAENIKKLILECALKEGDKVPSERALSERLGVAYVTVRKAMEILENAGVVLKKPRSGTVVRKLPETPKKKFKQIGLTVWAGAEINHPGTLKMLDAAYNVFTPDRYKITIIFITPEMIQNDKWDSLLDRDDLDGIIVRVQETPYRILEKLSSSKMPAVFIDMPDFEPCVSAESSILKLMDYLISLGHSRIALIDGPAQMISSRSHIRDYQSSLMKIKSSYNKIVNCDYLEAPAYSISLELLKSAERPTAIIAGDDFMAAGVLRALRELNLKCPGDISVCCMGGYYISEQTMPPLTVCRSVKRNQETVASELLREIIETGNASVLRYTVANEIIVRSSTGQICRIGFSDK